jgi:co-chaperonin GroES (HSP10)|tara:strand:+ start:8399 stop:8653 length:255 start_codon:yes stop_codon:yes gene_type:complete
MKAIGNFIVIDEINEPLTKTAGGLELTDKLKEDIRYRKGKIISSGPDLLKKDQVILFDRVAGFPVEYESYVYKVISLRDVIAII